MSQDRTGLASRRVALHAIRRVEEDAAYSTLAIPEAVADLHDARDRAFASHLAYDTLRWRDTLDWALGQVLDRDLTEVEQPLRQVLRLGAVQLLRSGVPDRAVVDTAVDLAGEQVPSRRRRGAGGFVNGVLRALARSKDELPWPDATAEPIAHLTLTTGHPAWIVTELVERLGVEEARDALNADNDPPGLTLRATADRDALLAELAEQGIDATPTTQAPEGVHAPGADPRSLAAVADGRAVPQDEASMLVARATRAQPGDTVLDCCAGPGGKATHLAALAAPGGWVAGLEVHPRRARLVAEAARRQDVDVLVAAADAAAPPIRAGAQFDRVLVDAPCTGLGTGRRRPEVRWRRTPEDVSALADIQKRLLGSAAERVRPGGTLTYAACTWTTGETTAVADWLTAVTGLRSVERRQLWPHRDQTDGMFISVWQAEAR